MEIADEKYFILEDYSNKCRCCFKTIADSDESNKITKEIEEKFLELTQLELIRSKDYPEVICQLCFDDLKYCTEFRCSLIKNQKDFYKIIDSKPDDDSPPNKSELKRTLLGEDPFVNFVDVKIEDEANAEEFSECSRCMQQNDPSDFVSDVQSHKSFFCNKCGFKATTPKRPERHRATTERRRPENEMKSRKQCPSCGIFVKNLSEHQKMVHIQVKRFLCDFCNYSCYFKTKITRHIQRHIPKHLREQFPCDVPDCNFIATRKDALKSHFVTMHQEHREKVCLCIECGKSFFNKSQLNIHIKAVHEKVKNHLCNHCGKSFFNVKDMEMHVKRHGVKDLACEICGNLFYCSLDLRRHLKIHSDPKIACEVPGCSKKFYTNSKLKMHVKVRHEGAKDFFCDYCSSRFSQYNNLKRHVNSVHKSLRINCLIPGCSYSVARKDKYKNHLTSQHKFLDEPTKESIMKSVKFE